MIHQRRSYHRTHVLFLLGFVALLSSVVLSPPLTPQQGNVFRVEFVDKPSASGTIGIFRYQGLVYGSLADLATLFESNTYSNPTTQKFELKHPSYTIKAAGGNPFVVVTDKRNDQQSVYQIPQSTRFAAGTYFVPLGAFLPLLSSVFDVQASLDLDAGVVRFSSVPTTPKYDISFLVMEEKSNGMMIRIPAASPLGEFESWMKNDGWLYITIADAKADIEAINKTKPIGLVSKIVAIQSPTSLQLTFKLKGRIAATELMKDESSNDIYVSIRTPGSEEQLLLETKRQEVQEGLQRQRKRWELDVVVIDPGHGGKDPGAFGISGTREKDITLGISLKLGKLIQKQMKGVKVVYTRANDSFVPLYRRGQIANEADGKVFISIHANSLKKRPSPVRGFQVYLLRPGRTQEAIDIAERENSVIELEEGYEQRYQELTEENFILVTMAQSAYARSSEILANIIQKELANHAELDNGGVHQAGLQVLVGASMPNVLVESAYLSNRADERMLKGSAGQQRIAEALLKALQQYKSEYEKLFREGQELGQR